MTDFTPSMLGKTIESYTATSTGEGVVLTFAFEGGSRCTIWPNGDIEWPPYDVVFEHKDGIMSKPRIVWSAP